MRFLKSKEMSETEMKFLLPVFSFGGLGFLFFMKKNGIFLWVKENYPLLICFGWISKAKSVIYTITEKMQYMQIIYNKTT